MNRRSFLKGLAISVGSIPLAGMATVKAVPALKRAHPSLTAKLWDKKFLAAFEASLEFQRDFDPRYSDEEIAILKAENRPPQPINRIAPLRDSSALDKESPNQITESVTDPG